MDATPNRFAPQGGTSPTDVPMQPLPAADAMPSASGSSLTRAREFALPFIGMETLETGQPALAHADAVVDILRTMGGSEPMQAAVYLVHACAHLNRPRELIARTFGDDFAALATETYRLSRIQRQTRNVGQSAHLVEDAALRTEHIRKMLLAFSKDLRVVLLRLASRLETLRFCAAAKRLVPHGLAEEALHVFAPLADRLGIWQIKWELEDLAFRFIDPETYHAVAHLLDEKRSERESSMERLRVSVEASLKGAGIVVTVQGRPKHIHSIVRKMRGKSLDFARIFDLRALRVITRDVTDCYAALSWVHENHVAVSGEFDDYIARPKPNGYQSLHTVVRGANGQAVEVQIRTQAMHEHAEHGVAAHWVYKEAGPRGYDGAAAATGAYENKIAVLRQLLAWERDLSGLARADAGALFEDRIYVLSPDAAVVELPAGATPVDFAYAVHTDVGHRCRGARVEGALVSLGTKLENGQTVEIIVAKEGGPSRDWLNPESGYLTTHRARSKVRAWFNFQALSQTIGRGREMVERHLQREGRTSVRLEDFASEAGFNSGVELFERVGKDEFSLRSLETRSIQAHLSREDRRKPVVRKARNPDAAGCGVLVAGIPSLMSTLAQCCRPAPPDLIGGFVTKGKGVSVHRSACVNFSEMSMHNPGRVIDVIWEDANIGPNHSYPVDVLVEAADRQGLLRDLSEIFVKERTNVIAVQTQSRKGMARMMFTVELTGSIKLDHVLATLVAVAGVVRVKRR